MMTRTECSKKFAYFRLSGKGLALSALMISSLSPCTALANTGTEIITEPVTITGGPGTPIDEFKPTYGPQGGSLALPEFDSSLGNLDGAIVQLSGTISFTTTVTYYAYYYSPSGEALPFIVPAGNQGVIASVDLTGIVGGFNLISASAEVPFGPITTYPDGVMTTNSVTIPFEQSETIDPTTLESFASNSGTFQKYFGVGDIATGATVGQGNFLSVTSTGSYLSSGEGLCLPCEDQVTTFSFSGTETVTYAFSSAVPEPSTLGLLSAGLLIVAGTAESRRRGIYRT